MSDPSDTPKNELYGGYTLPPTSDGAHSGPPDTDDSEAFIGRILAVFCLWIAATAGLALAIYWQHPILCLLVFPIIIMVAALTFWGDRLW